MLDTSLDAYQKVKQTLALRQKEVFDIIQKYPNHTCGEYSSILRKPLNTISGRFTELGKGTEKTVGLNLIKRVERRMCGKTRGNAWTWRVA